MQSAVVHAGLAIKCHALGKNSVRRQYINICQSVKVELPEEKEWDSWDGRGNLTLPMVLDDPRHRFDTSTDSYILPTLRRGLDFIQTTLRTVCMM